jgi:hypothetical protein
MEHILSFVSILIWQGIVIFILVRFRGEFIRLLSRVSKAEVGGSKLEFQLPSPSAETARENLEQADEDLSDEAGFLTSKGAEKVIELSPSRAPDERVLGHLLVFSTSRQRTWLVTTNRYLYCVLDGEKTREAGRLLQWRLALESAKPVVARRKNARIGLLSIGPRRNWLYSLKLFSTPESLEDSVRQMVGRFGGPHA